jgi:hypothetical protein
VELAVGGGEERARGGAASMRGARAGRPVGQAGVGQAVMRGAMACCAGERSQRGGAGRDEADGAVDAALTAGQAGFSRSWAGFSRCTGFSRSAVRL